MRLEHTISALTATRSVIRANQDSDGQLINKVQSETNTFCNVCKSKISITDLYEFIRHMHECQFNSLYLFFIYLPPVKNNFSTNIHVPL